jgi:threonine dehydratase
MVQDAGGGGAAGIGGEAGAVDARWVAEAAEALKGHIVETPCLFSRTLSQICGAEVWVKFENLQFTASFKERGALNKLRTLPPEARKRGVVAMSAGNHAQGVAYHAGRLGIKATIVMPEGTPFVKIEHTRNFGADVVLKGPTLAEAQAEALRLASDQDMVFIPPYDDPYVIAGQGTIALEVLKVVPDLDVLVVPIGGGGLISGIALAAKAVKPSIEVIGVQVSAYPTMWQALRGQPPKVGTDTIAEGIAVKNVGRLTKDIVQRWVDDVVLVDDPDVESAVALFLSIEKTVAEGAGAVGLAALLRYPERFQGRKVGLVLSGGNIDSRLLAQVIMRQLVREGRIISLKVGVADQPGALGRIATLVGSAGGNIIEALHQRLFTAANAKAAELQLTLECRSAVHARQVIGTLRDAGFGVRVSNDVPLGTDVGADDATSPVDIVDDDAP